MIDDARGRGCRIETCGEVVDCIIPPTIVIDPPIGTRFIREEVFGPVVVVMRATDIDDAIRIANDCEFGLRGSCFTLSLANALRMSKRCASARSGSMRRAASGSTTILSAVSVGPVWDVRTPLRFRRIHAAEIYRHPPSLERGSVFEREEPARPRR